jgi:hypothetical protein
MSDAGLAHPSVHRLKARIVTAGATIARPTQLPVRDLVVAGWTGRDATHVQAHIRELQAIGVAPPKRVPMFYRVSADHLTTAATVDVVGFHSTGEAEFVLLQHGRELLVGLGSDHTDRQVERIDVTLSKQLCPKPVAAEFWRWRDVQPHWDALSLRSFATVDGIELLYQQGHVTAMLPPQELIDRYRHESGDSFAAGTAMFCGTLTAIHKVVWAQSYRLELHDPILQRGLVHAYAVRTLPIVD